MKTFSEKVVELAMVIPKGRVTTYGRIAKAAGGGSMASRSVTGILYKAFQEGNKKIPWHRIVYTDGTFWTSPKHNKDRLALYKKEKIEIDKKKIKNFHKIVFEYK